MPPRRRAARRHAPISDDSPPQRPGPKFNPPSTTPCTPCTRSRASSPPSLLLLLTLCLVPCVVPAGAAAAATPLRRRVPALPPPLPPPDGVRPSMRRAPASASASVLLRSAIRAVEPRLIAPGAGQQRRRQLASAFLRPFAPPPTAATVIGPPRGGRSRPFASTSRSSPLDLASTSGPHRTAEPASPSPKPPSPPPPHAASTSTDLPLPLPDMADATHTKYEKLVRRLYMTNLFHPVKLGLDNIERLHEALGSPMDDPKITIIHIAGTNGKGSVALKIAKSLENAGNKVGLFCSPHVSSFRERVQVNGTLISESDVEDRLPRVFAACEQRGIPATFFEVTTALAFLHFAECGVDAVVLETGLGGRLDATNVVKEPALCVITSIGLEHTRILGDTVEQIASEKGGIIKKGRPVLVGPNCPHGVLKRCAEEKRAGGYYTCEDVLGPGEDDDDDDGGEAIVDYDGENSRIAAAAIELLGRQGWPNLRPATDGHVRGGTSVRPPCRFETVDVPAPPGQGDDGGGGGSGGGKGRTVPVVLDVAHNPDAMVQLVAKLDRTYPDQNKRIVCGFSADKDLGRCGAAVLSAVPGPESIHLVEAAHPRAATVEAMLEAEPRLKESNFDGTDRSIAAQVKSALTVASDRDEVLVVCGSVFLMAEAREALGYDEPRDSEYVAEAAGCNLRHGQENFGDADPEAKVAAAGADASGGKS